MFRKASVLDNPPKWITPFRRNTHQPLGSSTWKTIISLAGVCPYPYLFYRPFLFSTNTAGDWYLGALYAGQFLGTPASSPYPALRASVQSPCVLVVSGGITQQAIGSLHENYACCSEFPLTPQIYHNWNYSSINLFYV
jgi:hypothetical protein